MSKKKKQGVKKTPENHANWVTEHQIKRALDDKLLQDDSYRLARQVTMDKVILTLGNLGIEGEGLRKFHDEYFGVEDDYDKQFFADNDEDKWYFLGKIDELLKKIVPEDLFSPYPERLDFYLKGTGTDTVK